MIKRIDFVEYFFLLVTLKRINIIWERLLLSKTLGFNWISYLNTYWFLPLIIFLQAYILHIGKVINILKYFKTQRKKQNILQIINDN